MGTIATASITQLSEVSLSSELAKENARFLVSIDNETQQVSPTIMRQYFGGSSSIVNSEENELNYTANGINVYSSNTYMKTVILKLNDIYSVVDPDVCMNIHAFVQFSATASNGGNHLAVQINTNGTWHALCEKYTNANTAEIDVHIKASIGVQIKVTASGSGSALDANAGKINIVLSKYDSDFTLNGQSFMCVVPLNTYASEYIELPNLYGRITSYANISINAPEKNYDYGNNAHLMSIDDRSIEYVIASTSVTEYSKAYNRNFYNILTSPRQKIRFRIAGTGNSAADSGAYKANTCIIKFDAISDISASSNLSACNVLDFSNGTKLKFKLKNFAAATPAKFQRTSSSVNTANNIIGIEQADIKSGKLMFRFIDTSNHHIDCESDTGTQLMYTPSFRAKSDISGIYQMHIMDNISQLRVSGYDGYYNTFAGNLIEVEQFGHNLTDISGYCFISCHNLSSLDIPETVKHIDGYQTFRYCRNLTSITLPSSLTAFDNPVATFSNCSNLISVNINDISCYNRIGNKSFEKCTAMRTLDLRHVYRIKGDSATVEPFIGCTNLNQIIFNYDNIAGSRFDMDPFIFSNVPVNNLIIKIINCPNDLTQDNFKTNIIDKLQTITRFKAKSGIFVYGYKENALSNLSYINIDGHTFASTMA